MFFDCLFSLMKTGDMSSRRMPPGKTGSRAVEKGGLDGAFRPLLPCILISVSACGGNHCEERATAYGVLNAYA